MKIGDKVTFLNDVGGGVVAGFKGKNIVLVEDEDGFQIPTNIHDVVVVSQDNYDTSKIVQQKAAAKPKTQDGVSRSVKSLINDGLDDVEDDEPDEDPADKPVAYSEQPREREAGNRLSFYLAFVPMDIDHLAETRFEVYAVNDCNYFIHYAFLSAEGLSWRLRQSAEIEPNTKSFIEEIGFDDLNAMQHLGIQLMAYKREKPFVLKPVVDVRFRVNLTRFYKFNTFSHTIYFESPAMLFKIVENDKPMTSVAINPSELKRQIMAPSAPETPRRSVPVSRYEDSASKGNKKHSPYYRYRGLDDAVVVDLHADALLDTTQGLTASDILNYQMKVFRDTLAEHASKKGQRIVFIHGKGEGVLRRNIINELRYHYKSYRYQDASFQEYGYGATQVTIN